MYFCNALQLSRNDKNIYQSQATYQYYRNNYKKLALTIYLMVQRTLLLTFGYVWF